MADSSSSTINAGVGADVETQQAVAPYSHWKVMYDRAGVSDAVLNHKYPGEGTPENPFVVDWLPIDPHNPMQFSFARKWLITGLSALATFAVAFDSSAYSGGVAQVIINFRVSEEIAILVCFLLYFPCPS